MRGWNRVEIEDFSPDKYREQISDCGFWIYYFRKMNKKFWLALYGFVLCADLLAVYSEKETLRNFTKPLLMPLLIVFLLVSVSSVYSSLKKWIVLALLFSWAGDVLLMFEPVNGNFFIYGLVAFLLAHVFYILFYENIIRRQKIKRNHWLSLLVLIYYVFLMWILTPHLGEMKWPVWMYGLVISVMLMQALQTSKIKNQTAARLLISGAVLFIASDSILAINKFYKPFELAGVTVMLTYGIAQLLIALGARRYIVSAS